MSSYLANASEHHSSLSDEAPPLVQDDDKNGNCTTSSPIVDNVSKGRVLWSTSERLQEAAIDAGRDAEMVDIILAALTCEPWECGFVNYNCRNNKSGDY
jgi:hypothetical protein